jgi:hypothetical protein
MKSEIAFLDEVEQVESPIDVFLSDGDHQTQVGADESRLGGIGFGFSVARRVQPSAHLGDAGSERCVGDT